MKIIKFLIAISLILVSSVSPVTVEAESSNTKDVVKQANDHRSGFGERLVVDGYPVPHPNEFYYEIPAGDDNYPLYTYLYMRLISRDSSIRVKETSVYINGVKLDGEKNPDENVLFELFKFNNNSFELNEDYIPYLTSDQISYLSKIDFNDSSKITTEIVNYIDHILSYEVVFIDKYGREFINTIDDFKGIENFIPDQFFNLGFFSDRNSDTRWERNDNKVQFFENDKLITSKWIKSHTNQYFYVDESGNAISNKWLSNGGKWYFIYEDYGMLSSQFKEIDGSTYHFNSSGAMSIGWTRVNGEDYYFASNGIMQKGWQSIDGSWMYFDVNGALQKGWIYLDGNYYYSNSSGRMLTGWQSINNKWYFMNGSGVMQNGWLSNGGKWYYFNQSGDMVKDWKFIDSAWYKFNSSGNMQNDTWIREGSHWYYLQPNGAAVQSKWKAVSGKWYYFDNTTKMLTGWQNIDNNLYFLGTDGSMRISQWQTYSGQWYYLENNGIATRTDTLNFPNCTALKAVYPEGVPKGHPAYKSSLDRDKDNWACEAVGN